MSTKTKKPDNDKQLENFVDELGVNLKSKNCELSDETLGILDSLFKLSQNIQKSDKEFAENLNTLLLSQADTIFDELPSEEQEKLLNHINIDGTKCQESLNAVVKLIVLSLQKTLNQPTPKVSEGHAANLDQSKTIE